jgi:hypothetical protein
MRLGKTVVALCVIATAHVVSANTAVDNVKWSATHVDAANTGPECTAYSKRRIDKQDNSDAVDIALKLLGTAVATAAMSKVGHSNGSVPDPCKYGF